MLSSMPQSQLGEWESMMNVSGCVTFSHQSMRLHLRSQAGCVQLVEPAEKQRAIGVSAGPPSGLMWQALVVMGDTCISRVWAAGVWESMMRVSTSGARSWLIAMLFATA